MRVAIVGGGAAGVFAAISCKSHHPQAEVVILEKTDQLLQKVKVSGGGRCNVTHNHTSIGEMARCYPRGSKVMKKLFPKFFVKDTIAWFAERGVKLKVEEDGRMFPTTDSSQTIINCFLREIKKLQIDVWFNARVSSVETVENGYTLEVSKQKRTFDKVIWATGGVPNAKALDWLKERGYVIEKPIPSLFTFNMKKNPITQLMGVVANPVTVTVEGFKYQSTGPLLVTHWGMSGPAVLKLSAYAAAFLSQANYEYTVHVNWLGSQTENEFREELNALLLEVGKRKIGNKNPFELPARLWEFLLQKAEVDPNKTWNEVGKKALNKLINTLLNDIYDAKGKTTFKEEFVTAGGISWSNIQLPTMESKIDPGMYFAGELLDVDGITGGFNFQAAWTTGYLAGKNCLS